MVKKSAVSKKIPEQDIKDINEAIQHTGEVQSIVKKDMGVPVKAYEGARDGMHTHSFSGKVLKHNKMLIPVGGTQVLIGSKGQKWDDIPLDKRRAVTWFPSDFE